MEGEGTDACSLPAEMPWSAGVPSVAASLCSMRPLVGMPLIAVCRGAPLPGRMVLVDKNIGV